MTKKQKILREAARLFAEKGFIETSTQEIAEAAETATGTIFYHFATKEGILKEIYVNLINEYLETMKQVSASSENGLSAVEKVLRMHFAFSRDYRAEFTVCHRDMPAQIVFDDNRRNTMRRNTDISITIVKEAIERGIADGSIKPDADPVNDAKLIKAMLLGTARLTHLHMTEFDDAEKTTCDFCMSALRNRGKE
ncbi:TetR/AcrR family transcriptional regulator [Seleniivibrio sp.]|uniref:TetR/AcrR family transcriptional regulator n=1 Tax=Seleniivibrio sp. TaxID=2898801 RepID=UPI0025E079D9|nr:TetR/AcrR family transcriptional regulator [Seleniivibrio sp.]MCD8554943.1 TetR/AcrR family transcriptional regulator [Seleniivibrio sp.]